MTPSRKPTPPPTAPEYTLAVHDAGHCVMASHLGIRLLSVSRREDHTCDVSWSGDEAPAAAESHALVALAGVAAQWLFRPGTVRAVHVRRDDTMASAILRLFEPSGVVERSWREYLRQKAIRILSAPREQHLIARLTGFLAGRQRTNGRTIQRFLDRERQRVPSFLSDRETTLEDRIGLTANSTFATPLQRLRLDKNLAHALRTARISTLGRLLQYSAYDLKAIVPAAGVEQICRMLASRGFELPKVPRSTVRELSFSIQSIYESEEPRR